MATRLNFWHRLGIVFPIIWMTGATYYYTANYPTITSTTTTVKIDLILKAEQRGILPPDKQYILEHASEQRIAPPPGSKLLSVRMPDGTIIRNVPEGTTQEELLRRYEAWRDDHSRAIAPAAENQEPQEVGPWTKYQQIEKFRKKYPEYNDLSDSQLVDALYKKILQRYVTQRFRRTGKNSPQ